MCVWGNKGLPTRRGNVPLLRMKSGDFSTGSVFQRAPHFYEGAPSWTNYLVKSSERFLSSTSLLLNKQLASLFLSLSVVSATRQSLSLESFSKLYGCFFVLLFYIIIFARLRGSSGISTWLMSSFLSGSLRLADGNVKPQTEWFSLKRKRKLH